MNPVIIAAIIELVEKLIENEPAIAAEFQSIFLQIQTQRPQTGKPCEPKSWANRFNSFARTPLSPSRLTRPRKHPNT